MEEVETQSEYLESVTPQTENHVEPQEPTEIDTQEDLPPAASSKSRDHFKALERKRQQLERELQQQKELNEKLLEMATRQTQSIQPQINEEEELDEEYIPKGKVKKLAKKEVQPLEKRLVELEEKLEFQRKKEQLNSLKRLHSDFEDIVNPETLALLEIEEPELASTIADLKDPYKIALHSYKYIKALGLATKAPESRRAREVEKKLEKASKTVQSPMTYDKRPLAQAYIMTDAEKTKLYEEMVGYAGQAGFGY